MVVDVGTVKQHIRPKADSTLSNMRKRDLIEYIRSLEHNYNVAVSFNENQAKYVESLGVLPRWIPVSERLPDELSKDNCEWSDRVRPSVDVLVKTKGSKLLYTAWYSYSHKDWIDVREEHCFRGVTHWMPLPEPPKEDAQ